MLAACDGVAARGARVVGRVFGFALRLPPTARSPLRLEDVGGLFVYGTRRGLKFVDAVVRGPPNPDKTVVIWRIVAEREDSNPWSPGKEAIFECARGRPVVFPAVPDATRFALIFAVSASVTVIGGIRPSYGVRWQIWWQKHIVLARISHTGVGI